MKKFLLLILLLLAPFVAHGQSAQNNIYGCANTATFSTGAIPLTVPAGYTQILAAPSVNSFLPSRAYHICSFDISLVQPATPVNFGLATGSGTNCATNTAFLKAYPGYGVYQSAGQVYQSSNTLNANPNTALCVYSSGAVTSMTVNITYATQ